MSIRVKLDQQKSHHLFTSIQHKRDVTLSVLAVLLHITSSVTAIL